MSANTNRITATLAAGSPPPRCLTGGMVEMVTLSRKQLEIELELIGDNLHAAARYCQLSSTFRAEARIRRAQERLDRLMAAITGADPALHDALCEKAPTHTGPRGINHG
jgi:hypothetical protein